MAKNNQPKPVVNRASKSATRVARKIGGKIQRRGDHLARKTLVSPRLLAVTSQLEDKVIELETANNDLNNLLASTEIATIFLNRKFHLMRFTPAATHLVGVRNSDLGRPLGDFALNFTDEALLKDAQTVLEHTEPIEAAIQDSEGRWYLRRVIPYRDEENRIQGVVLTFVDITLRRKLARQSLNEELERHLAELANAERQRLGRDLHDTLGQQISALGIMITALRQQMGAKSPWTDEMARLEANLDLAKSQLRLLAKGLLPVDVDADGLRVALTELAEQTTQAHSVDCRFECPEAIPVDDNFTAIQLFLIAREAVHNAIKHAAAKRIVIRLEGTHAPRLSIVDNGNGIQADDSGMPTGIGVQIMRHRCRLIGGNFSFLSLQGSGTTVTCSIKALSTNQPTND
jgi:signal transduction histidine kinase